MTPTERLDQVSIALRTLYMDMDYSPNAPEIQYAQRRSAQSQVSAAISLIRSIIRDLTPIEDVPDEVGYQPQEYTTQNITSTHTQTAYVDMSITNVERLIHDIDNMIEYGYATCAHKLTKRCRTCRHLDYLLETSISMAALLKGIADSSNLQLKAQIYNVLSSTGDYKPSPLGKARP